MNSPAIFGNFLITYITAIFGSKYSLFVSVAFYAVGSLCFLAAEGFFLLSVGALLFGFNDQFISILLKIIMNDLFGSDFTHFLPICYAGFAFSSLVWPNIMSVLTNPGNERPDVPYSENGETVYYFGPAIVDNFQFYIKFQVAVHVGLLTLLTCFFSNPRVIKNKVSVIFSHISKGRLKEASIIIQHQRLKQETQSRRIDQKTLNEVKNVSLIQSISKTILISRPRKMSAPEIVPEDGSPRERLPSLPMPPSHSFRGVASLENSQKKPGTTGDLESPLMEMYAITKKPSDQALPPTIPEHQVSKRLEPVYDANSGSHSKRLVKQKLTVEQKQQAVQEYHREEKRQAMGAHELLWKANFMYIFLMCTLRTTTGRYYMSNFKIVGLFYFDDDVLINTIGSMVFGGYILMTFTFGRVFDILGTRLCHKITFALYALGNLLYAIAPHNLFLFVTFSFIHRVR